MGHCLARSLQCGKVDTGEPVECLALRGGPQQALVGVLPVDVDEFLPHL